MNNDSAPPPLTPAVLHVLLALVPGERHGYEIMKQVKHDSQGHVTMGPGTLYGSIKRMLAAGLIEEAGERPASSAAEERRRYYRLTAVGQRILQTELQRYRTVVALAQERRLFPGPQLEGT